MNKGKKKTSIWDSFHWTPPGKPIPPEQKDDPVYDYARREYNRKYTLNGINLKIIALFLSPFVVLLLYAGFTHYINNQQEENIAWRNWTRRNLPFLLNEVPKVNDDVLTQYVGNLVEIPAGDFYMGVDEVKHSTHTHTPQIYITLNGFKMMESEVTFAQWQACVEEGGCLAMPDDNGWGKGQQPVINISYTEIQEQYIPWLYKKTGYQFALPSEAQWEYAASLGGKIRYVSGDSLSCDEANWGHYNNHRDYMGPYCGNSNILPVEIKNYAPNAWGLYDMVGNVAEMCLDDARDDYTKTPRDGSALDLDQGLMASKVIRGGSFKNNFANSDNQVRGVIRVNKKKPFVGFRLIVKEEL